MIHNPIFKGFNPDPCICRKGDDYYIAVSYPHLRHSVYHQFQTEQAEKCDHGCDCSCCGNGSDRYSGSALYALYEHDVMKPGYEQAAK